MHNVNIPFALVILFVESDISWWKQNRKHKTPKLADCLQRHHYSSASESRVQKACATEELTCNCHVKALCSYTFTLKSLGHNAQHCFWPLAFFFLFTKTHWQSGYTTATSDNSCFSFCPLVSLPKLSLFWQKMHLVLLPFPNFTLPKKVDVIRAVC